MSKVIAIYSRVSSKSQDTASQDADLTRWAAAQELGVKWYKDKATGTNMDRPGFTKMMDDARTGKVAAVVVWRLDRLGRTNSGLTALFDELKALKVNLVSVRDGLDLSTTTGRMVAGVLASLAQYETEVRAERTTAGLAAAKANGVKLGRKPGIHTKIKVTPEQEVLIRRLKGEGTAVTAIARSTGLSRPTIYSVLKDR